MNDTEKGLRGKKRIWLAVAAVSLILAMVVVPPFISIRRYKSDITRILSASLGRPVHLSSVELRLLPRPGFALNDLTIESDPQFGAEPVLHASTVTAAIRLLSLWRGRLVISSISVDDASLNLVRNPEGRWNLEDLFHTAATRSQELQQGRTVPFPYLEATNSRVNIKNGLEKLPFSLVNADISLWQENPGDWRVRLRGQPARTDVSLDLADTGILELDGSLRHAPSLRQMPIHFDLEWREAQLGQLSRLITGSDPGWRGDLTGDMHLDGTAEATHVTARLRATGVHRAEFAPAEPLDFDANCSFVYGYAGRDVQNLACDSPLGDGHFRVDGEFPGNAAPRIHVELVRIPVQAGLDLLRTMRAGLSGDLAAAGNISGRLAYDATASTGNAPAASRAHHASEHNAKNHSGKSALLGSLTVEGLRLSGGPISQPIAVPRFALDPSVVPGSQMDALRATVPIAAGGPAPLDLAMQFTVGGYRVNLLGPAALPRIRELAQLAGFSNSSVLDSLSSEPATLDLTAQGPWLPAMNAALLSGPANAPAPVPASSTGTDTPATDQLTGTVALHGANWKSDMLANRVEVPEATLHVSPDALLWDHVAFAYGPVKGTASLNLPLRCEPDQTCPPQLELHFLDLDAAKLEAALLGAHQPGTLLSSLISRFSPAQRPVWPRIDVALKADSLALGPVTVRSVSVAAQVQNDKADITGFDGSLLGGQVHLSGTVANADKPAYTLDGTFTKLAAPSVCQLLKLQCARGTLDGSGKIDLIGFTDKELASSAAGKLHFDWRGGSVAAASKKAGSQAPVPAALARFTRWIADATIGKGAIVLGDNQVRQGGRNESIKAAITLGDPPTVAFSPGRSSRAAASR